MRRRNSRYISVCHALIQDRKTAQARAQQPATLFDVGRPTVEQQEEINGSVTTINGDRGATYLTARIARDRPDILERMQAGEYKSGRVGALARRCTADASYPYLYSHLDGLCS